MKLLLRLATLAAMIYAGLAAVIYMKQRSLLYFPTRLSAEELQPLAAEHGYLSWTNSAGLRIGWWRPADGHSTGTVMIAHGNASLAARREHLTIPIQACRAFDVFVLEYPGFADRPGEPTEDALCAAAEEGFQLLAARRGPLLLVGESLGTGVASFLAGRHADRVTALVLLAPFTRLTDVAATHYPWLPVRLMLKDRYPSVDFLRPFRGPLAVLVGEADSTVPARLGRELHESYSGPKRLWSFPGQEHWEVIQQPADIWMEVFRFLEANPAGARN